MATDDTTGALSESITPQPSGVSDFAIYTASMELGTHHGAPVVSMVGSSTTRDLEGDTMLESALSDMTRVNPGLLIWMNHRYSLPDDLFGSLVKAPHLEFDGGIADLHLLSDVELSNPAAARTHKYIERGRKLGVSVGARVDKASIDEDLYENTGRVALLIESVTPVEWSVVGIPCNQRSWVEGALKGYATRTLSNPATADARIARLMKSLWPKEFDRLTRAATHEGLRKMLWSTEAQPTTPQRIIWDPPTREFRLSKGAQATPVSRETIEEMFSRERQASPSGQAAGALASAEYLTRTGDRVDLAAVTVPAMGADPAVPVARTADATPLLTKDPKDGDGSSRADDKAHKAQAARAHKYGIAVHKGGNVTKPGKWADVPDSQWGDPVNYKYPMRDAAHARNAWSRWGDAGNRSFYSKSEQGIVGARIKRRCKALGVKTNDK